MTTSQLQIFVILCFGLLYIFISCSPNIKWHGSIPYKEQTSTTVENIEMDEIYIVVKR